MNTTTKEIYPKDVQQENEIIDTDAINPTDKKQESKDTQNCAETLADEGNRQSIDSGNISKISADEPTQKEVDEHTPRMAAVPAKDENSDN